MGNQVRFLKPDHHSRALRLETADAKAERIIKEELARLGWD